MDKSKSFNQFPLYTEEAFSHTSTLRKNMGPPPRGRRAGFDITPKYDGYQSEHPFPRGGPPPRFY